MKEPHRALGMDHQQLLIGKAPCFNPKLGKLRIDGLVQQEHLYLSARHQAEQASALLRAG